MKNEMKIIGIVTIYNPDCVVFENILILSKQVTTVILTDNSIVEHNIDFEQIKNIVYIKNKENLGLSSSFNKVLEYKDCYDSDFLVFFDQDSQIEFNYINWMIEEFLSLEKNNNIGCLGPAIFDVNDNTYDFPKKSIKVKDDVYEVQIIITSGMLTRYSIIKECAFWNESVFLDFADWDLCWRMMKSGFKVYQTRKLKIRHSLGQGIMMVLGFKLRLNSEIRIYYIIRDGLRLLTKTYVPLNYKFYFLRTTLISPWIQLLFFKNRFRRLRYILYGYLHFLFYKKGSFCSKIF